MSNKEAVRDLLERLPDDATIDEIANQVTKLNSSSEKARGDVIVTPDGYVMLPIEITSEQAARAVRADRDGQ